MSTPDTHGNTLASEGVSRCECGCKYWENDRCVDCGTGFNALRHGGIMRLVDEAPALHPDTVIIATHSPAYDGTAPAPSPLLALVIQWLDEAAAVEAEAVVIDGSASKASARRQASLYAQGRTLRKCAAQLHLEAAL